MQQEIVRCPYCVLGNEFRPMFRRGKKFTCFSCGHFAGPDGSFSKCACPKCQEMNRIATRCRGAEDLRKSAHGDLPLQL